MYPGAADPGTDERVTSIDGILAAAVLVGLARNAALGWWWAYPAAGCVLNYYAAREVREIFTGDHGHGLAQLPPGAHVAFGVREEAAGHESVWSASCCLAEGTPRLGLLPAPAGDSAGRLISQGMAEAAEPAGWLLQIGFGFVAFRPDPQCPQDLRLVVGHQDAGHVASLPPSEAAGDAAGVTGATGGEGAWPRSRLPGSPRPG